MKRKGRDGAPLTAQQRTDKLRASRTDWLQVSVWLRPKAVRMLERWGNMGWSKTEAINTLLENGRIPRPGLPLLAPEAVKLAKRTRDTPPE